MDDHYFAAMMLHLGQADGLLAGIMRSYREAVRPILQIIGTEREKTLAGIYMLVQEQKLKFFLTVLSI